MVKVTESLTHILPYPISVDRATFAVESNCGPIQLTHQIGHESKPQRIFFRSASPVYNIQNTAAGGNEIIPLRDTSPDQPDVVAVTFTNTTLSEGAATIRVFFNYTASENQKVLDFVAKKLMPKTSVTIHIVLKLNHSK